MSIAGHPLTWFWKKRPIASENSYRGHWPPQTVQRPCSVQVTEGETEANRGEGLCARQPRGSRAQGLSWGQGVGASPGLPGEHHPQHFCKGRHLGISTAMERAPKAYLKVIFVFPSPSSPGSLHNSPVNLRAKILSQGIRPYSESQLTEKILLGLDTSFFYGSEMGRGEETK